MTECEAGSGTTGRAAAMPARSLPFRFRAAGSAPRHADARVDAMRMDDVCWRVAGRFGRPSATKQDRADA
ncbi:hypothetical protein SAMN02745172_02823 [Pseudoxanthobacter soli DSM 19599]|uniref:Uncharacterized protein n=1 Tax=Pseudoxanthobacter soli DSM 19599 TaxID=1123029 RepID=A0A1M7ZMN7_9HYPH|nr:hypothetical protein SAMN02745172_02823 [Pseudoxanthobacter soli DSM 19599]